MKKFQYLFVLTSIIFIASCGQNKSTRQESNSADIQNTEPEKEPGTIAYSASLIINNKTYQSTDVSAVAVEKTNEVVIQVHSNTDNENETFYLVVTVSGIATGNKKLDTIANRVEFTDAKTTYESLYTDDCSNSKSTTNGTITIKSIKDYTTQADGAIEADFEGQLMRKYEVPSYPCANGTTTNKKIEFINVKGSLKGSYINTKAVPL